MIKARGYNNDSGLIYKTAGLNQYKGNQKYAVNINDTAEYENKTMEDRNLKRMNDNLPEADIQGAGQLKSKEVKRVEKDMELKANPSEGSSNYRIEPQEQLAQKISADTAKRNMMVNENFQKIPPLKYIK